MSDHDDGRPSAAEMMQRDEEEPVDFPPLNVHLMGPAEVRVLPHRGKQTFRTLSIGTTPPVQVLNFDPTRSKATIIATTDDVWIGSRSGDVNTVLGTPSAAVLWPPSVPFETESTSELWLCSTAAQSISVVVESWEN